LLHCAVINGDEGVDVDGVVADNDDNNNNNGVAMGG